MFFKDCYAVIADDCEHKDFFADINYQGKYFLTITQEEGFENLEIEIYNSRDGDHMALELGGLLEAVEYCKKRLWELRKDA